MLGGKPFGINILIIRYEKLMIKDVDVESGT